MAVPIKYVRRLKSGRLEYRRAYPDALKKRLGAREMVRSLGTTRMAEPAAMLRYEAANADL